MYLKEEPLSKAKDIARAEAGNLFRNESTGPQMVRKIVCAHCHEPGHFVKVGEYYFHEYCPKTMIPFPEEVAKSS